MDSRKGKGRRKQRSPMTTTATATTLLCSSLIAFFSVSFLFATARSDLGNPTRIPRVQGLGGGGGSNGKPGSYPPLCDSKCGACTPCNPVHEAVRPGQPAVEEYYPEAWRCKCANKLYMP